MTVSQNLDNLLGDVKDMECQQQSRIRKQGLQARQEALSAVPSEQSFPLAEKNLEGCKKQERWAQVKCCQITDSPIQVKV